ncbi:formylglycine-generating enzyme family protein [endosymbiont of unidentified scaly snail isolate Monju]|uniref:formylglycine-generating enzyme family protein n=1 Tax=endosymbiont of unidentified scaly snail isolate Monju TaxID=1248727 RepID=UPI00068C4D02
MSSLQPESSDRLSFVPDLDEAARQALQARTAEALGLPVRFRDPLDAGEAPELAVIPAGMFEMGSPEHEFGHWAGEGPQHYQQITRPFAIGVYPVTAEEFAAFTRATGWRWRPDLITSEGRHPVINIRHGEAEAYCAWLSERTGQRYRLPSEAEWEYACRAGTTTPFAFGDSVSCREVHFKASFPYEEARDNKRFYLPRCAPVAHTLPVGSYRPNTWGLHDMHGNVWEMTESNWRNSLANLPRVHPAPVGRRNKWIVVRGGSWFDAAVHARSAARRARLRDELDVNLGFRVVREL